MPFLSWLFGRATPPPPEKGPPAPVIRQVVFEWKDRAGRKVAFETLLTVDHAGRMTLVVPRNPPSPVAQVREMSSSYPVEIVGSRAVPKGYELRLDYLWEGRRREKRIPAEGPAILEFESSGPIEVEVLNVSSGGMQLFSTKPLRVGGVGRIKGHETVRQGLVRYCTEAPGGYRVGVQFFGDKRNEEA